MTRQEALRVLEQLLAEVPAHRRGSVPIEQALGRPLTAAEAEAIPELYKAALRAIEDLMAQTDPKYHQGKA